MQAGGRLAGRVALVTGAASGLGRAVAASLAQEGAAVAVNFHRSEADAYEAVEAIQAGGGRAVPVRADVSKPDQVAAMASAVRDELGLIELLVTSAGVTEYIPGHDLSRLTKEVWERIVGVNLLGTFFSVQAVVSQMQEAGSGAIALVASNSAYTAQGSSIPYVVSKSAVVTLAQALTHVLPSSIRVNAVAPGWMDTPWLDKYLPASVRRELAEEGRFTPVQDVADAIVHLLCNESVDGVTLRVDAGEAS